MRKLAHRLKGSLGLLGARRARALAIELERGLQEPTPGRAREDLAALETQTDLLREHLADLVNGARTCAP